MKKIGLIFLAAIMIITLSGCQSKKTSATSSTTKAETSVDKIKKAGKIVVGTEATFPPFESVDTKDGKTIVGFDMDISQAVADKLGVKLEVKDMKFDSLVEAVKTGMIDFTAAGMNPTADRAKVVDFSQVYFNTKQVLVIKDSNTSVNSAADLSGKTLGAQLGTTSEKAAKTISGVKQVKTMDKVDELMLEVKSGRLDGVVVENVVAGNYLKVGGLKIVNVPELNTDGDLGIAIAVKKGDADLLKVINDTIVELKSNGQYDKLLEKWGMSK
ncbi:MAG: transporter substrate-binding domain-containing protein [Candidatus Afipia apatlaquensis]|uniref:Transporter substrate-binding domain-containing protein n=1 Tax=Candidatus Afipia apatlaquensis TaxID=2712852 RepID=A0A7C9RG22_9BRAD|nr:transporter substrate-binding domain-containing protein [Candidatus Afipia apatlaquensis]